MASLEKIASLPLHGVDKLWSLNLRPSCPKLLIVLLTVTMLGCGPTETTNQVVESVETESSQRVVRNLRGENIVSKMSPVRLRLPRNWSPVPSNNLHPTAELQAHNPSREIFVIVLGEDRTQEVTDGALNQQAQSYLQILKAGLNQVLSQENLTEVNKVNGFDAVQYNVRGEVFGTEVAYLHTTVAMNDRYYQVVAWTPNSRYSQNVDEMQAIIQEFQPD